MLNFTENRHRISEEKSHKELFIGTIHLETRQDKRDTKTHTARKILITAKHSPPSLLFTKRLRTTSNPRCLSTQQKSTHASLSTQIAAFDTSKKSERPLPTSRLISTLVFSLFQTDYSLILESVPIPEASVGSCIPITHTLLNVAFLHGIIHPLKINRKIFRILYSYTIHRHGNHHLISLNPVGHGTRVFPIPTIETHVQVRFAIVRHSIVDHILKSFPRSAVTPLHINKQPHP